MVFPIETFMLNKINARNAYSLYIGKGEDVRHTHRSIGADRSFSVGAKTVKATRRSYRNCSKNITWNHAMMFQGASPNSRVSLDVDVDVDVNVDVDKQDKVPQKRSTKIIQATQHRKEEEEQKGRTKKRGKNEDPTELIFKLERRGEGWGEEILPHLTVERRPLQPKRRGRRKLSDPAPRPATLAEIASAEDIEGQSLMPMHQLVQEQEQEQEQVQQQEQKRDQEQDSNREHEQGVQEEVEEEEEEEPDELVSYLGLIGVPTCEIDQLVATAVAWHETPGGKKLKDRRRQRRLLRNLRMVAEYLEQECGVPKGPEGVGTVFRQVPELMLCKPSSNDRWDRRAVELAAFKLKHGHCNVPELWEPNPELGAWVKRQRVSQAGGQLSSERFRILQRMGFEFGDLAQVTEEWEMRFDQLIDWMLWHGENGQTFSWITTDWGARGGKTARELALWMSLQREFRRRQILPMEAIQRFEALQVEWEPRDKRSLAEIRWMDWLGRLLYVVERRVRRLYQPSLLTVNRFERHKSPIPRTDFWHAAVSSLKKRTSNVEHAMMMLRKEAIASGPLSKEEPGVGYWLERQRWLWRQGKLPVESVCMLHLAGVDMDTYTPTEWQFNAHYAAKWLQGSRIRLGIETTSPRGSRGKGENEEKASRRLRVKRWVQTQRALFADGRLSPLQLRYISFLGIPWILSDQVVMMEDEVWIESLRRVLTVKDPASVQWLNNQRGLRAVGLLSAERCAMLESHGVSWEFDRDPDADAWDEKLSQLLVHSIEVGGQCVTKENERYKGLASWVESQYAMMSCGKLSDTRAAQLKALGLNWN